MKAKWMASGMAVLGLTGLLVYTQSVAAPSRESAAREGGAKAKIGETAPDFTLKDTFGKEFKLSEFKDHTVVLEWLNQQCPVSLGAHKKEQMQKVYKEFAGKGVIWLGIDSTDGRKPEENRVYAAEQKLAYPILNDTDGAVGQAFGATRTPHMFVIDKKGTLAYSGAIDNKGDKNYVAAALDDLVSGREVQTSKTEPYGCGIKYKQR